MRKHRVKFMPDGISVEVERGTDLLRAATLAGIPLRSSCGGEGACGLCAVLVREGEVAPGNGQPASRLKKPGHILACTSRVESDLVIEVPPESRLAEHKVLLEKMEKGEILAERESQELERYPISPLVFRMGLKMDPPTLTDCSSDLSRLKAHLRKAGLQQDVHVGNRLLRTMPETLRKRDWEVVVSISRAEDGLEMFHMEPGFLADPGPGVGLAIDIGTTTVVTCLVDMAAGVVIDRRGAYNRQARYGDDIINRIIHAAESPKGLSELQEAGRATINDLIKTALKQRRLKRKDVQAAVVAGNTTMAHLFLGLPPKYIRLEPYTPVATEFAPVTAGELGIAIHPEAPVWTFPAVASYVGGDIISGVLVSGMAERDEVSLFIDIGTNGEMVLGNGEWLVSCACSAGPCFEGGGISCGMRAMPGAIERMTIDPGTLEPSLVTIGGLEPIGICGSGLVDALAQMRKAGIIDRSGQFALERDHPRIRVSDEGPEYVVVPESDTGKEVFVSENDVKNLLRAKGAVYAGIRSLLKAVDLPIEVISRIYIAGGFGNYLNIREAVEIGLLPDVDRDRYVFIGNSSIKGARLALMSREASEDARSLARKMTYLELSVGTTFMEEFISAMFLPHTDLDLFPSVTGEVSRSLELGKGG